MDPTNENEDISQDFFALCSGLEVGELVTVPNFRLADVMSAIELGEPKMDMGVGSHHIKCLDDAIKDLQGLYEEDYPMQLAVLDATLAMMVAWLEGSSLASTVWTNVALTNAKLVRHLTFSPFAAGVNLFLRNVHSLVSSVGNIEELPEDFNPQMFFLGTKWSRRQLITSLMKDQIKLIALTGAEWTAKTGDKRPELACGAIQTRLKMIVLLLEILGLLVPPEIEDPNFDHKVHLGEYVSHEKEYEAIEEEDSDEEDEEDEEEDEEEEQREEQGNDVTKHKGECCSSKNCHQTESKVVHEKHIAPEPVPVHNDCDDGDSDATIQFKPSFLEAARLAEDLVKTTKAIATSIHFGRKAPGGEDGDYTWLPAFDSKSCIRHIPACFPRTVHVPSRKESAEWWVKCAYRIRDLCLTTPTTVKDLNNMFYFARTFNIGSCILTRSLLQICMFPTDNHLCGDDIRTVADPIEVSLKSTFFPQVLDRQSPVYHDKIAQDSYMTFLQYMTKLAISVYSSFGCNLSRQRDRLESAIEEFGQVQFYAGRLEARTDEVMIESKVVDVPEKNISFHSVSTFVFNNLLATVHHFFELGFRMELYVPYEFTYIFWFMGQIEAKWLMTTLERSQEIQMAVWRESPLSTTVNQRQTKEKAKFEENVKKRLASNQFNIVNQYAMTQICDGIVKLSVVLIRKNIIRLPPGGEQAEKLRFERRFETFENLGPPLSVDYDEFRMKAGIDGLYERDINKVIDEALASFTAARTNLENLDNSTEQNIETIHLLRISKTNSVACNLLKMDLSDREVEWSFNEEFPLYPGLKITKIKANK